MDSVQRAIWFVESHLAEEITLDDVAGVAGLSRHHMVRAFGQVTGRSVMRYVRARRLSRAAEALAAGAPDILAVALDAGYGSHEAFTRAFRDQFGTTPETVRAGGCVRGLALVEPLSMEETAGLRLDPPRFVDRGPILFAGLLEQYRDGDMSGVPNQWQRFAPWLGHIPHQVSGIAYGVVCNGDDEGSTDYLSAMEVGDFAGLPPALSRLRLGRRRYAVWAYAGHISEIRGVWAAIWGEGVRRLPAQPADAPFFELYPAAFDPMTGEGGFEVWLPVES